MDKKLQKRALAQRIKQARKLSGKTLREIGDHFSITASAVDQWENDEEPTTPRPDRLSRLADLTGVSLEWLMTGAGEPHDVGNSGNGVITIVQAERGRRVPKISAQAAVWGDARAKVQSDQSIPTRYPCGPNSFAIEVPDKSNSPEYMPGDTVVIDPDETPAPGDMVLAVVGIPPVAVFRQYFVVSGSPKGTGLQALNAQWESFTLYGPEDGRVIGVMTEYMRPRR